MKIKLNNICWVDKHGNDIDYNDMNLNGLPGSFVLELGDGETRRLHETDELRNVCKAVMDGMFKSRDARVESLDVVWPGDQEQESPIWTTKRTGLPASAPRMAWLPGHGGKYLVNIDSISVIWFRDDGSGFIYLNGSETPLAFPPGGADEIVRMMDAVDQEDADDSCKIITAKEALALTEKPEEERYGACRRSLMETIGKCIIEASQQGMKYLTLNPIWKRHTGLYSKLFDLPTAERRKLKDDLVALGYEVVLTDTGMDIYWRGMVRESSEDE